MNFKTNTAINLSVKAPAERHIYSNIGVVNIGAPAERYVVFLLIINMPPRLGFYS